MKFNDPGLWSLINFAVLAYLLIKYAGPAITGMFKSREEQIAKTIHAAEAALAESRDVLDEQKQNQASAEKILDQVAAGAKTLGESLAAEIDRDTATAAARIQEAAKSGIESEKHQMLSEIRGEILDLAFAEAERSIVQSLDGDRHRALVDSFAEKVGGMRP